MPRFTHQIIALPDDLELRLHEFRPKTLAAALFWTLLFLIPLVFAILRIGDGIAAVLAIFGILLCLVPLSVANRSFTRAQITFNPDTISVKLRHLFTWRSASSPIAQLEDLGLLYRSHGGADFAMQLAQRRIMLIFQPIPADVAPILEALISHAKALNHPAFAHLRYDSRNTTLSYSESALPDSGYRTPDTRSSSS